MPHAVVGRRLADDLPEHADEGPSACEADVEADVGDAAVGLAQQEHRAFHPPPLQVTVGRLPEDGPEAANEVRFGDVCHGGYRRDIERLGVSAVHRVTGAQQAPVQVLDFPAHGATLRHREDPSRRLAPWPALLASARSKVSLTEPCRRMCASCERRRSASTWKRKTPMTSIDASRPSATLATRSSPPGRSGTATPGSTRS